MDNNVSAIRRYAVGVVINYFPKQGAAAVRLTEDNLSVGDSIIIEGTSTYLEQHVESLMRNHSSINKANKGQVVGLGVAQKVRKNDRIFRVERV